MAMYIYDRDEIYNEGHWRLQYVIPYVKGLITDIIMNNVSQPITDGVVDLGAVVTKNSLLEKTSETWIFTLENGTKVTKTIILGA